MQSTQRRLPHEYPQGKWLFVTWHLHDSVPHARYPPPGKASSGAAFVWMDRFLDTTRTGPMFLAQERVASLILESLRRGVLLGHYELAAHAIMANHVHVLLLPKISPSRLLQSLKGTTARRAEDYGWSSASTRVETSLDAADTSVCATLPDPFA